MNLVKVTSLLLPGLLLLAGCASTPEAAPLTPEPDPQQSSGSGSALAPAPAPGPAPAPAPPTTPEPDPIPEQNFEPGTPEHLAYTFYTWYLTESGAQRHPVINKNLPETVMPAMAERADSAIAADPFLCAQNAPRHVLVDSGETYGAEATLTMKTGPWEGPNTWSVFEVRLILDGEQWRIDDVQCHRP